MNLALIDILEKFLVIIWPMLRLSAFLAFTSIFSIRAVNLRIRMCLGDAVFGLHVVAAEGLRTIAEFEVATFSHTGHGAQTNELIFEVVGTRNGSHKCAIFLAVVMRFIGHVVR